MPTSADELHALVRDELGVTLARRARTPGNSAPFDYLCHAFFEPGMPGHAPGPRDAVVWACRGGGKTFMGALATMLDLVFKPGVEVRILAGSLEQASRMHEHLSLLASHASLSHLVRGRVTSRRLVLTNGSRAELLAASQTSVRGARVQKLRCDEVELFDPELWEAAQLTTRSRVRGSSLVRGSVECLSTMHLPGALMARLVDEAREGRRAIFRWGIVDVLEACPAARACESCPLWDECRGSAKAAGQDGHVSIDDAIDMKRRVSLATWESEMLCRRPSRSDAVFPEFDERAHVLDPGAGEDPYGIGAGRGTPGLVCGMDFGIRSPSVVLWARTGPDGVLRVLDERIVSGVSLEAHARAILDSPWGVPEFVAVDPAGEARSIQTGLSDIAALRSHGLAVRDRRESVASGVRLIRARLRPASGAPTLLVHRRCAGLIRSLQNYRYESDAPKKDGHDHAVDALRYLLVCHDRSWPSRVTRYVG